ncbi:uncharacterized protein LOC106159139 [Lingula anatina]|uniref:Glycosyltransferase family 92 protein n=1 Tax=Lingula anatina TaxID=7574 RepID=A0A1S3I0B9_LINAN|nr:uncharacterized protein LOC106159139 [Lingula anatina]|eukprot:XP_013390794.1 uncharacterized protein LOC106159139 [Lingula anatina]
MRPPLVIFGLLLLGLVFYLVLYREELKGGLPHLKQLLIITEKTPFLTPKLERHDRNITIMKWLNPKMFTEIYVLSAYYDDRPTLDPKTKPVVRIIGVADKGTIEDRGEKLFCIVWHDVSHDSVLIEMEVTHLGSGAYSHGRYFRQYIFICPLTNITIIKPSTISVTDGLFHKQFDWKLMKKVFPRIPVRYPEKPTKKMDFGQCTSITYWTVDPYRVVEWAELHRIWGVKEMNIYGSMVSEKTEKVFRHYHQEGFLTYTIVERPMNQTDEAIFFLMSSPVINDCIYRNMYRYNKIIVVDLDEMIVPRGNLSNYPQLLDAIESSVETRHPYRMYNFRNLYFFFELPQNEKYPVQLRTLRQIGRLRDITPYGTATKSIIDPMACTNMHNHFCWRLTKLSDTHGHSIDVHPGFGLNQHYKKCHFDQYMVTYNLPPCKEALKNFSVDYTMLHYKDLLLPNVESQWIKLGL